VDVVDSIRALLKRAAAFAAVLVLTLSFAGRATALQLARPLDHAASHRSGLLKHTSHFLVRNIVGQAGDRSATVTWDAPLEPYGSQVVAYSVVANYKDPMTGKRVTTEPVAVTDVSQRTATITGLINGVWNDFTITARSNTEWSAVNTNNVKNGGMVKPSGLPCAATVVNAVPGNKKVTVKWNRPCNGGATAVFNVTTSSSGQPLSVSTNIADNHTAPAVTVTGLTNGVAYTFTVTSTNVNGSVTSVASNVVTPRS
jgi:Fibronectin type III domain